MECGVCWATYDPALGDSVWQVPAGTPFEALPGEWRCPKCDSPREKFVRPEGAKAPTALEQVREAYQTISLRMQDLPIFHAALQVELIGFREFNGSQVGVVVTPWFMNVLVVLPKAVTPQPIGSKRSHGFPAGAVEFVSGFLEGVGATESCSLFSPMHEFRDQGHARAVAHEAMDALFAVPAPAPVPEAPSRRDLFRRAFSVR